MFPTRRTPAPLPAAAARDLDALPPGTDAALQPGAFWGQVTGRASGTNRYAWVAVDEGAAPTFAPGLAAGFDATGGPGANDAPAYEITGRADVPTGARVKLYPTGDLTYYTFVYTGPGDVDALGTPAAPSGPLPSTIEDGAVLAANQGGGWSPTQFVVSDIPYAGSPAKQYTFAPPGPLSPTKPVAQVQLGTDADGNPFVQFSLWNSLVEKLGVVRTLTLDPTQATPGAVSGRPLSIVDQYTLDDPDTGSTTTATVTTAPGAGGTITQTLSSNLTLQQQQANGTTVPAVFANLPPNFTVVNGVLTSTGTTGPAPNAPTSLAATVGNAQLSFTWAAPASGQAPSTYTIQIATDSGFTSVVSTTTGFTGLSGTVGSLTNGTLYYARVGGVYNSATGPWSSSTSATPSQYLLYDTFTSNAGTLNGRAVEFGTATPTTWAVGAGNTLTVAAGKLSVTDVTGACNGTANSGRADVTLSVDITAPASGTWQCGPVLRQQDANNYWRWLVIQTGVDQVIYLYEIVAGTPTIRLTYPYVWAAGTTHTLRVVASGTTITVYFDGTNVGSYGSATNFSTQTTHGMRFTRDGASITDTALIDNWSVSSP